MWWSMNVVSPENKSHVKDMIEQLKGLKVKAITGSNFTGVDAFKNHNLILLTTFESLYQITQTFGRIHRY